VPELGLYRSSSRPDPVLVGIGLGAGALAIAAVAWWWLSDDKPKVNPLGHVMCPVTPYSGSVAVGDYVVIELMSNNNAFSEPTWAEVLRVQGNRLDVRIAGESGVGGQSKPLMTARHGFKIGDVVSIEKSCVFDKFKLGQDWTVICGPALTGSGFAPISGAQASILGVGDDAMVLIRDAAGNREGIWVRVASVSAGQQVISGTVLYPTSLTGVVQDTVVEFLRDCVVDAAFN